MVFWGIFYSFFYAEEQTERFILYIAVFWGDSFCVYGVQNLRFLWITPYKNGSCSYARLRLRGTSVLRLIWHVQNVLFPQDFFIARWWLHLLCKKFHCDWLLALPRSILNIVLSFGTTTGRWFPWKRWTLFRFFYFRWILSVILIWIILVKK